MNLLLIDNYDSFTYNLAHLLAAVTGRLPTVITNDDPAWATLDLDAFDAAVISPGPGRPERPADFGRSLAPVRAGLPTLGVCLGHQGLAHHFGGRVEHAAEPMHGRLSPVFHDGTGLFEGLPSPFEVVRYHSLVVADLPSILQVTARLADGVVMGLRHRERPLWGVQFHPESICTEHGEALLANFCRLASAHRVGATRQAPGATRRAPEAHDGSPRRLSEGSSEGSSGASPAASTEPPRLLRRPLDHSLSALLAPDAVFGALFADSPDAFWLDGAADPERTGRSWMGDASGPRAEVLTYDVRASEVRVRDASGERVLHERLFDVLDRTLRERRPPARPPEPGRPAEPARGFALGYVGYLGYELKADCGAPAPHAADTPDAALIYADRAVAFDPGGAVTLLALGADEAEVTGWMDRVEATLVQLAATTAAMSITTSTTAPSRPAPPEGWPRPTPPRPAALADVHYAHDDATYRANIAACLEAIRDGESYELCLTTTGTADTAGRAIDPLATYLALRRGNPAPYAAYLRVGGERPLAVLSSSPERFLTVDASGLAESKPIKGTCARSADAQEDWWLAETLRTSEKERAENLMIVDLVRNDLGRVCSPGTVRVPRLFAIESYATVHQLVSTVQGQLRPGASTVDCVRACFPAGSMTGAPKLRTMALLDDLEGRARGVYAGALGYLSIDGAADLSVVIRTLVAREGRVDFGVGGAIVALSDPGAEVAEIHLKARALLETLGGLG